MARTKRVEFQARAASPGREFPIDMLRYDGCFPSTEQDSYKIMRSLRREEPMTDAVLLQAVCRDGQPFRPNLDRWHSFGWELTTPKEIV